MSEQTLNVNVSVQKDVKKKNVRKAGKTLLIKPADGVDIDESWFNGLSGVVSVIKTAKTGSYFLTFDNIGNSLEGLKLLRKDHEGEILVKFAHYKLFFTMTGLSDDSDYNSIKTKHIKFIEENTDSKVLYYKLYRNKSYLGCGDVTIDTKVGLDILLDKDKFKEFDLDGNTGVFYRFNRTKSKEDEANED
tara:strand:+ start:1577 stop:2146 length:570 start_codon:yes stop_codon:yes gene_type:complete